MAASPPRQPPTRRQLEVLWAYIRAGSVMAAAYELGISETPARQHLSGLYRRTGCLNAAQAAYLLGSGKLLPSRRPPRVARRGSPGPPDTCAGVDDDGDPNACQPCSHASLPRRRCSTNPGNYS